ncbi:hypothetical protein BJX99DRAFT_257150 [Aspergillus californicus]
MPREPEPQAVLRCSLCNKPFDKQSTLTRHGYYCRSRRAGHTTRPRSCVACAKGKLRCDNRKAGCLRCTSKGVACYYPAQPGRGGAQHGSGSSIDQAKSPSLGTDTDFDNSALVVSSPSGLPDSGLGAALEGQYLDWDGLDLNFAGFLDPQGFDQGNINPYQYQDRHSPNRIPTPSPSIPPLPSLLPRLLIQRPILNPGTKRTTTLILHTLKSYVVAILRDGSLPPFIHPSLVLSSPGQTSPDPLTRCMDLLHTLSTDPRSNRALFWTHIRVECERLCVESQSLDSWGLLSAMQALAVYILLRLDEGETEANNVDFLLLATVTIIAKQLPNRLPAENTETKSTHIYKTWLLEESRRRLALLYRVINMLVYFEPAAMCDIPADLLLAPLPAKKQLWEASDEGAWIVESRKEEGVSRMAFGVDFRGELVRLDVLTGDGYGDRGDGMGRADVGSGTGAGTGTEIGTEVGRKAVLLHTSLDIGSVTRSKAEWEDWCSGMDGLGGVVMLVASLVAGA